MSQNNRIITFDALRIFAAFAVVCLHTPGLIWYDSFPSVGWDFCCVFLSLVRWSVPMFVMISGALFLDLSKNIGIKRIYQKNIVRIVYAYLFWSLVFVILTPDLCTSIKDVLISILKGPAHLWFLKMLIGLYIIIPLLREIVTKKRIEIYFLSLSFIVVFVIPTFLEGLSLFNKTFSDILLEGFQTTGLDRVAAFSSYYVLGHFLYSQSLSRRLRWMFYTAGIASFLIVISATFFLSYSAGHPNSFLLDYVNLFTYFETAALFVLFKEKVTSFSSATRPIIVNVSVCCFGIYLVHPLVKNWLGKFFIFDPSSNTICFMIPLFSLVVFIVSCLLIRIIRYVPYLGKNVV